MTAEIIRHYQGKISTATTDLFFCIPRSAVAVCRGRESLPRSAVYRRSTDDSGAVSLL